MNAFKEKFKEVIMAILPITAIVLLLHFTLVPLEVPMLVRFLLGALLITIGLSFFLIGVDVGVTPLGSLSGSAIAKSNKLSIVIVSGLVLGFFISMSEPGLIVLANQVASVTGGLIGSASILVVVSIGMAVMLALGFMRVVYNWSLRTMLIIFYLITGGLALLSSQEFFAIAFDASGATTGVLAVPFILALALGVAKLKKNQQAAEEDSFGLVAITSVGAIIGVLILQLFSNVTEFAVEPEGVLASTPSFIQPFLDIFPDMALEGLISVLPLAVILFILQKIAFKLNRRAFARIVKGFIYALLGLIIFLVGVNGGFMEVGTALGQGLAVMENSWFLVGIGFVLGFVTIMAEPAVYVLTHSIENITNGSVKRVSVLMALSIGVGAAIGLSMLRIVVPGIQLWHYLLPGYIISFALTLFVPKLFVGMAFDAGGVATGPMTATFILAFTNGAAEATNHANILIDGFGMIAVVAMTPIITLQILGFIFALKQKREAARIDA